MKFQFSREINKQRSARARTLIQLGGLIVKSGITEKLGIKIGADLQQVEDQKNKAYTLLGLLVGQVSVPKELEKYETLGKQFLFENHDNNVNQEMLEISENLITD